MLHRTTGLEDDADSTESRDATSSIGGRISCRLTSRIHRMADEPTCAGRASSRWCYSVLGITIYSFKASNEFDNVLSSLRRWLADFPIHPGRDFGVEESFESVGALEVHRVTRIVQSAVVEHQTEIRAEHFQRRVIVLARDSVFDQFQVERVLDDFVIVGYFHGIHGSGEWPHIRMRLDDVCLLYTSPSPRDLSTSRMPSSA